MAGGMDLSWAWAVGFITFTFGIACGIGIAYLMPGNRRRAQELQDKLQNLQQEFDNYHEKVGQHFLKTSELVQKMTNSYRDVYEHLAAGSQALCQTPVNTPQLDIPETPTLESGSQSGESDHKNMDRVPETETSEPDETDSHAFLGDAPRVPTLDTGNEHRSTGSPSVSH